jgi:hypothetical protein
MQARFLGVKILPLRTKHALTFNPHLPSPWIHSKSNLGNSNIQSQTVVESPVTTKLDREGHQVTKLSKFGPLGGFAFSKNVKALIR